MKILVTGGALYIGSILVPKLLKQGYQVIVIDNFRYHQNFVYLESPISKDPDKRDYIVSSEKIEKVGFKAQTSIQQGIAELLKGYQIMNYSAVNCGISLRESSSVNHSSPQPAARYSGSRIKVDEYSNI